MTSPNAKEILNAAAAGLGIDVVRGATAEEWRNVAELLSERMAEWLKKMSPYLADGTANAAAIAKRVQGDKDRIANRQDQIDKVAIQSIVLNNSGDYDTIAAAIRDLQVKPQFSEYPERTLRGWISAVWTKERKPGRPRKTPGIE